MRVGVLEICQDTHYPEINSLVKIYSVDPLNEVIVFTNPEIKKLFNNLSLPAGVKIVIIEPQNLAEINKYELDRLHIVTISKYYDYFLKADFNCQVFLTIHNIDLWFAIPFFEQVQSAAFRIFRELVKFRWKQIYTELVVAAKEISRQKKRIKLFQKYIGNGGQPVVHSQGQKVFLKEHFTTSRILVLPFAIYEEMEDNSGKTNKIRICIPGVVSSVRRDYKLIFTVLKENQEFFKGKIILDLLGYVPENERTILKQIEELNDLGIEVRYYLEFIPLETYDKLLSEADIFLGNINVQIAPNQKYGATKETGVTFNMIRAGKPGIFPESYFIDSDLEPCVLKYKDAKSLLDILKLVVMDRAFLLALKKKSRHMSERYSPNELLKEFSN